MPDVEVCIGPAIDNLADIDIALIWKPPPQGFQEMSNLKAILSLGAGVDQLDLTKLPPQVPIARLVDTSLISSMCEYCLLAVLRYTRQFDRYERQAKARMPATAPCLANSTAACGSARPWSIGRGSSASSCCRRFSSEWMEPYSERYARSELLLRADGLNDLLRQVSILICLLPLTAMTSGILNAKLFAALPRGAYLINVGRGSHLVEDDLLTALQEEHLAEATLDVFQQEPLPSRSSLLVCAIDYHHAPCGGAVRSSWQCSPASLLRTSDVHVPGNRYAMPSM